MSDGFLGGVDQVVLEADDTKFTARDLIEYGAANILNKSAAPFPNRVEVMKWMASASFLIGIMLNASMARDKRTQVDQGTDIEGIEHVLNCIGNGFNYACVNLSKESTTNE